MRTLHLFRVIRNRPRLCTAAAVAASGSTACAICSFFEKDADVDALPLIYDFQAIAAHWQLRPWAVHRRRFELTCCFVPFFARSFWTWYFGGLSEPGAQAACAAELRSLLEEGGPTFIKLGQALSSRPDLLPPPALRELQLLCDACPSFEWNLAKEVLLEGLLAEPESVFSGVVATPVSAASLGQVYQWEYKGRQVAVKVQRPDLRRQVSLDLYIIRLLAKRVRWIIHTITNQRTDHVMLIDVWAGGTWSELNYIAEGKNQDEFRDAMDQLMPGRVYVPRVIWEVSSPKVLVTEWVDGPKLAACSPNVVKKLVGVGIECFCLQLLELGIFHSDPHPGNILVRDDQLVLIDFGLVARIEKPDMNRLALATVHLIRGDHIRLFDDIVALGFLPPDSDREAILGVLSHVLDLTVQAGSDMRSRVKNFKTVSDDLNQIFFEFPFQVPPYFALITRALLTLEGIALEAMDGSGGFDIFQASYPYALKHAKDLLLKGDPATSASMAATALALKAL
eukprot:TRINITY_DN41711_c0_g1_i1.p1 TRINITY_DN41711_c0_g1~~TRINITY_DN41711_c0_g1_i1.p1  ORF type:complete len:509 (-),score=66.50 TRINITY_DN41711_c0_g1_i1:228-1754(-)